MISCFSFTVGSGKSTVARICQNLGGNVIDADKLGHRRCESSWKLIDFMPW